jgi:site-specific DNA recombinase
MRIAIYVRVSTQRQAQTQTIEQQIDRLRAHLQAQGWPLQEGDIFRDDGYSGASLKRPGLDRLRDRAALASFDKIFVTDPDRLARKYVHQMLLLEELQKHGCRVEFLDRPMSQDPHDQLLLQIRGAVAEYERTLIAERMRRGRQRQFQAGKMLPWTRAPYGYRMATDRPRDPSGVYQDPAEAPSSPRCSPGTWRAATPCTGWSIISTSWASPRPRASPTGAAPRSGGS